MSGSAAWVEASQLNELGRQRSDRHEDHEAAGYFERAIAACDEFEPAWFNLGLVYKRARQWEQCSRCNLQAARLGAGAGDPSWWNLGIAATALRDWPTARMAWGAYGIAVPPGDGELQMDLGSVPIRVGLDRGPEVVWCARIDPARGVIHNVPSPGTGRHWRDIVLHDGTPAGERKLHDRVVPVFDELECWQPSNIPTSTVTVRVGEEADAQELSAVFESEGCAAEDWTRNVRILCRKCSEGRPFEDHDHPEAVTGAERLFGLAGQLELTSALLDRWAAGGADRRVSDLTTHEAIES